MALTIFVITPAKKAQSEICLALNNSEFHELFKNAEGLNHKHFINKNNEDVHILSNAVTWPFFKLQKWFIPLFGVEFCQQSKSEVCAISVHWLQSSDNGWFRGLEKKIWANSFQFNRSRNG